MKKALTLALLGSLAIGPAWAAGMGQEHSSSGSWQGGSQQSRSQQSSRMDEDTTRQVQQQLQQQGYDVGEIDGKWGQKSQQALTNFQRDQNLTPSGRPDPQTLAALGVDSSASQQAQTPNERSRSRSQGGMQDAPQD
jgi:peptidoglycan hydrolase-like protein with peptidoglycan-binding domain